MNLREEIKELNKDLNKLESLIIKHFTDPSTRLGRNVISSAILAQFYLRPELTHKELQERTGYSAGAISNTLQYLLEQNIITEYKPVGRGAHIYKIKNMASHLASTFTGISALYLAHKNMFQEIKDGLDEFPEEHRNSLLYQGVKEYSTLFLEILPVYEIFSRVTSDEIEKI